MRTGNLGTWLLQGTYPRLYVPIVLIILLVSAVRYHYLVEAETQEVQRHAAAELRRVGDALLPALADIPLADRETPARTLRQALARLGPGVQSLKWEVAGQPAVEAVAPRAVLAAPGWFVHWVEIAPPVQQVEALAPGIHQDFVRIVLVPATGAVRVQAGGHRAKGLVRGGRGGRQQQQHQQALHRAPHRSFHARRGAGGGGRKLHSAP